jgi:hypothetical protein
MDISAPVEIHRDWEQLRSLASEPILLESTLTLLKKLTK